MKSENHTLKLWLGTVCSTVVAVSTYAQPPVGTVIVGLNQGEWHAYVMLAGGSQLTRVTTGSEPRHPHYCVQKQRVVYGAADGAVREVDLESGSERVVLERTAQSAYMQPTYAPDCESLYVVVLAEGTSQDTDIVKVNRDGSGRQVIVAQRSAQFDPHPGRDGRLYYGSVACVIHCGKIIKEIWAIDPISGVAEQQTLLNSVSQQPVLGPNGTLFFTSNRDGYYHLWLMSLDDPAQPTRLTSGSHTDVSPAVGDDGDVYFIRRSATGTALMRLSRRGPATTVPIGFEFDDIRDLKIATRRAKEAKE